MRQEDIPYTLIPIGGYSELEARKNQIFGIDPDADEDDQVASRDCEVRYAVRSQTTHAERLLLQFLGTYADPVVARFVATDSRLLSARIRLSHSPHRLAQAI